MDGTAQKPDGRRKRSVASTDQGATKKKKTAYAIKLFDFIQIVHLIFLESVINATSKNIEFKNPIGSYFVQLIEETDFGESKLKKLIDDARRESLNKTLLTKELVQNVYNYIINESYVWIEAQSGSTPQHESKFLFPKEMLKLFLATYNKCIEPKDFQNTSSILVKYDKNNGRTTKSSTVLTNGSILFDYLKGVDVFIPNLSRCESGDIRALKFIVENEIELSLKLFQPVISLRSFQSPAILTDVESVDRSDTHAFIPLSNTKPLFCLVTADIVTIFDGNNFSMPSSNNEREFNATMKKASKLRNAEYLLLEVLFSNNRSKVIDVVACNTSLVSGGNKLPLKYRDRLQLIETILPGIRMVNSTNKYVPDCSYIQKPLEGYGPSYTHSKHNLTTAAVGLFEKSVVLAFLDPSNPKRLVVKTRTSISGPSLLSLYAMPFTSEKGSIMHNGEKMEVLCDLENVRFFETAITYEYKDASTKIGNESRRSISLVSDFKTSIPKKDVATEEICRQFDNNKELLHHVFCEYAHKLTEDDKAKIKGILDPDVQTSFTGY